jgi:hypothetical protein
MSDLPQVTVAVASDEANLIAMCRDLHRENGLFSFNETKVLKLMRHCYARTGVTEPPVVVGVIRGSDGKIEASTCLMVSDFYYTDDWHLGELWTFVEPPYRKSHNAEALIKFGMACAEKMKIPYFTGIVTNRQMAGKVRLYRRLLGHPAGAFFIHNANWKTEPIEDFTALRQRLKDLAAMCNGGRRVTFEVAQKQIGPALREAAEAISAEDSLWGASKPKANGHAAA